MNIGLKNTLDFVKKVNIEHPSNLAKNSVDDLNKYFCTKIFKKANNLERTAKTDFFLKMEDLKNM